MQDVKLALIGAGGRGAGMAGLLLDSDRPVTFAALAEPLEARRVQVGERLNVDPERRFADHRELLAQCRGLDGAIIATDVSTHATVACACLEAGVPIYLEKPMTRSIAEAQEVVETAQRTGVPVMIGFNLRYAPFYHRLQQLVAEGVVGDVMSIEWKEVLSPAAWAVGYCRSSWYSRQDEAGGWLLEKSCHDIDQINWLAASPCVRVASFGSRSHFNPRTDLPQRCTDGCPIEAECPYSCFKVSPGGQDSVPGYVPPERWDLCVYHCGSDLMDRQVAIMEYETGTTAAFTIVPSGPRWERLMRICGTKATIRAGDHTNEIRIYPHGVTEPMIEDVSATTNDHGGADPRIIGAFVDFIADPTQPPRATLADGLESMLVAGGIEHARDQNTVIELEQWRHGSA
jgi:predicted dehydrogenase